MERAAPSAVELVEHVQKGWVRALSAQQRMTVLSMIGIGVGSETVRRARKSSGVPRGTDDEVPTVAERAKAAIAETPTQTNVAIAKRIGVSEATVRRARASSKSANDEMTSRTERAEAAIAKTPAQSNVEIAKRIGVSEATDARPPCRENIANVERAAPKVARSTPELPQIIYVPVMALFKRKTMMEKLETELAALRARAETLSSRHAAADAAFLEAKSKLQRHNLEADLDADDKARAKLEAAVAAHAVTRDGYADALGEVQAMIADTEQKMAAERALVERKAASEELARKLDEVERVLPDYLGAARRLTSALEAIHFHYEANEMARFVGNTTSQVEVAAGFALAELRAMAASIRNGSAPIPAPKPAPEPVTVIEPPPPTMTVFMLRSANYRDENGRARFVGQYEDAMMPVPTAQRALRHAVAVSVADPRRAQLRGARGSDYRPLAPDVVDLDAIEEPKGVPYVGSDPALAEAHFTEIDRSGEARTVEIAVPRF